MATRTEQMLDDFRAELNKLMPAVGLVDEMTGYVELVRGKADAIQKEAERILKEAEVITKKDITQSREDLKDFKDKKEKEIQTLLKGLSETVEELNRLTLFLKNADISGKLGSIELRIDNLNTSLQSFHSRLDALERVVRDENAKVVKEVVDLGGRLNSMKTTTIILSSVQLAVLIGLFVWLLLKS